ncbi:MAG: NAD-dependent epimerase/dehydratase family protein [Planctomycetia bacterium]|nr:NAD-dependent epimerase/dehydratase family protein [Planctomycetia bacterium]
MSDPILVTGATGLVGNNVVRTLLGAGHAVRTLVRVSADSRPLEGLAVEQVTGDVTDAASVAAAVQGCGAVIHAAAEVHIGRTGLERQRRINVEGTRNIADAARKARIRLVHVSTCDAIGQGTAESPATEDTRLPQARLPYVITKREAERVVLGNVVAGLDAVIVNPAYMIGPWDWKPSSGKMLLEVAAGRGTFAPRGSTSLCDVRDVAQAIVAALTQGASGERYILAGRTLSWLELWRKFAEVSGGRRPVCRAGPLMIWIGGWGGDVWGLIRRKEPAFNSASARHAWQERHYSSAKAEQALGYTIRPAEETIRDAWAWFQEHDYARRKEANANL